MAKTAAKRTKKIPGQARQGDVFFERVAKLPPNTKPVAAVNGRLMLAYGEATGHHHSVRADVATLNVDEGGVMYLTVEELIAVEHQEHDVIPREPGVYKVTTQREYRPQGFINVSD